VEKTTYEELNDVYFSPKIVWVIKSWTITWLGHVVRMGEMRCVCRVLVEKSAGKKILEIPRRSWQDILRWVFRKWDVGLGLDSRQVQVAGTCECGNEPSGSIKQGGISWLAKNRLASQDGLSSMEWESKKETK